MPKKIKYTCACCGKVHEQWPALAYLSPIAYQNLSDEDQKNIAQLTEDFCVITHPGQTDRFIRCTLSQKVIDHCDNLEYGLWVSLSEKSYHNYTDNFKNENHETTYFGWLNSELPEYDFSDTNIPTTIYTKPANNRPEIVPHENFDHPFVHDYYKGITKAEAEMRIKEMLIIAGQYNFETINTKPWWKLW
jgi:hypothetical protein